MTSERPQPVWWESFTELRETNARIETKLDRALAVADDLVTRVSSLEIDRTAVRSDVEAVRGRTLALENDRDARDMSPGAWREWKSKVDNGVTLIMNSAVASVARRDLRRQDWALLGVLGSLAATIGGLIAKFAPG